MAQDKPAFWQIRQGIHSAVVEVMGCNSIAAMNVPAPSSKSELNLSEPTQVKAFIKNLVDGKRPGILATVDVDGRPQMRWMSSLSFKHLPLLYSLTSPHSRKVEDIEENTVVNWMFFNEDNSVVVNLHGRARIIIDPQKLKEIWSEVVNMNHLYFIDQYASKMGFVAIETLVERVEVKALEQSVILNLSAEDLLNPQNLF